MSSEVNFSDVQGLVRFGYGWMKEASYFLVRVKDIEAARSWLRSAPITSAVKPLPSPSTAMQVAFTAPGLQALGVSDSIINGFSHEFVSGMAEPSRSRRLGDVENNAPSKWDWGGCPNDPKAKEKIPHLLVMFFAEQGLLKDFVQSSTGNAWNEAFVEVRRLETSSLDGIEPFGFADGISQPEIDWQQQRDMLAGQLDYSNFVALGEFLLGYRNEYGKYTDRPLVDVDAASAGLLPAEEAPEKRDVGKNGTYLVMRQLHQDVRKFWQSLSEHAGGDAAEVEKLAAAMVGRTRTGDPLVPIQQEPIPGIDSKKNPQNHFTFDGDPAGRPLSFRSARAARESAQYRFSWATDRTTLQTHHNARLRPEGLSRRSHVLRSLSSHSPAWPRIRPLSAICESARAGSAGRSGKRTALHLSQR